MLYKLDKVLEFVILYFAPAYFAVHLIIYFLGV